jgi:hypothetical protein
MTPDDLQLSSKARVRLAEVFETFQTRPKSRIGVVLSHRDRYGPHVESLGEAAARILRREFGEELDVDDLDLKGFCLRAPALQLTYLVIGSFAYLRDLERIGGLPVGTFHGFAEEVNEIVAADDFPMYFDEGKIGWTLRVSSDAEALRRALLQNPDEAVACKQGDPQVEMVVSTVQSALARRDPVVVDYGAGLGRILVGLGTADRFKTATYIAVDEPIAQDVESLAATVGAKFIATPREAFVKKPTRADVVILMNTLHHIPFHDLPRQIGAVLKSLKDDGVLVIQEIGELRQPEQLNVPWRTEDIVELFQLPGCVTNPRSTTTRSQRLPLTHMLVHLDGAPPNQDALTAKVRAVWTRMKARALDELRELYAEHDPESEATLQHVLITNANLDLNKPG